MTWRQAVPAIALLSAVSSSVSAPSRAEEPLRLVQTIELPGVNGRIDHMALDLTHRRLFVAALGNGTVEVVDLKAGKRLKSLTGFHEPQGIGYDPGADRLVVANGESGDCDFFDGTSLQPLGKLHLGDDADDIRMDKDAHIAIVGYADGGLAFLDMKQRKLAGDITFPGHPEAFAFASARHRIYVNIPSQGQIAVVDRSKRAVTAPWPVTKAHANFPITLDTVHHRLIIGCRTPARLLVYNTDDGKVVSSLPIVGDTDDIFYDAARSRVYVTGGEGYLDVFAQETPDRYVRIQHTPTAPGARTSLCVPQLRRLYVAVPHRGDQKAAIVVFTTAP